MLSTPRSLRLPGTLAGSWHIRPCLRPELAQAFLERVWVCQAALYAIVPQHPPQICIPKIFASRRMLCFSCLSNTEGHWMVQISAKHTAADVIQGASHPQAADAHPRRARPRLPALQLHLHGQQLHPRSGVRPLQAEPKVKTDRNSMLINTDDFENVCSNVFFFLSTVRSF